MAAENRNAPWGPGAKPVDLTGTFPSRLYQARRAMGLSQSDLARSVWGTVEDARGYTVAKSRDRVSAYEKGKSAPTRENLEALARVLGLAVDQLAPDLVAERAHADTSPVYRLTALEGQPNIARLQVDMVVSMAAAAQVMVLLSEQSHKHGTAP